MKSTCVFLVLLANTFISNAQDTQLSGNQRKEINTVIDQYSLARETRDTILLKKILRADIDQLVSTGEWRTGIAIALEGMMKSSTANPGSRTLTIDKMRLVTPQCAIVDCRYEIGNSNGTNRKMWSSFIMVEDEGAWKIFAIRNMLPAVD